MHIAWHKTLSINTSNTGNQQMTCILSYMTMAYIRIKLSIIIKRVVRAYVLEDRYQLGHYYGGVRC